MSLNEQLKALDQRLQDTAHAQMLKRMQIHAMLPEPPKGRWYEDDDYLIYMVKTLDYSWRETSRDALHNSNIEWDVFQGLDLLEFKAAWYELKCLEHTASCLRDMITLIGEQIFPYDKNAPFTMTRVYKHHIFIFRWIHGVDLTFDSEIHETTLVDCR